MENIFTKAEEMADNVKEYFNNRIDSVKLSVAETSSKLISNAIVAIILAIVLLPFFIFAGVALSLVLGEWIGKIWAGFLIVALLYWLIGVIVWTSREKLIRLPIMNSIIKQLYKENENN